MNAELFAPAKLTLSLRVVGVRRDGYHEIDSEMVSVSLGDRLVVSRSDCCEVVYVGDETPVVSTDDDLIVRALKLADRTGKVRVEKAVPVGAGLGGGSSDAAAVLRWSGYEDPVAASTIGADVAFCLFGGRARVTGIGETVEALPFEERTFTLLTPPLICSTSLVYERWDELNGPTGDNGNDLEPAALDLIPDLANWRDKLAKATGESPRLAGSGGTWFVEGEYPGEGRRVVTTVPRFWN